MLTPLYKITFVGCERQAEYREKTHGDTEKIHTRTVMVWLQPTTSSREVAMLAVKLSWLVMIWTSPTLQFVYYDGRGGVPRNMEFMVRSLRSASFCQSVVNSTSACRPSVCTSTRSVVTSKFSLWSCIQKWVPLNMRGNMARHTFF